MELTIASGKGGVGKSTVASTLAIELHKRYSNVIAVDADADAPNLHLILGVDKWDREEALTSTAVAEIDYEKCTSCGVCKDICTFRAIKRIDDRYVVNDMLCEGCKACQFVCPEEAIKIKPSESGLIRIAVTKYGFPLISAKLYVGKANSGKLVMREKELAKEIGRGNVLRIVDAAAGIGCQVIASLAGSDLAILVAEPTPASLSDLKRVYALTRHFMIPVVLVINKYDLHLEHAKTIEEFADKEKIEVIGKIPYDERVPMSMAKLKPFIEEYPNSETTKSLLEIVDEGKFKGLTLIHI